MGASAEHNARQRKKNIAIIVIHSTIIKYSTHKQAGEDSIDAQLK
jgi:hypothetical protein